MRHWHAAAFLGLAKALRDQKRQPAFCQSSQPAVLRHQRGLLCLGDKSARVSFSLFCTQKTPQVYVHLGGHSVCCCTALGGSFAPQFVCQKLGQAADSAVSAAGARKHNFISRKDASGVSTRIEVIQALQQLFAAHDSLYFSVCKGREEYLFQGCSVCFLGLLPFGITTAFLGEEPAIVLNAEDSPAAAATQKGSAAAGEEKGFATSHMVAWPLGAPEAFRRHVEMDRLQGKAAHNYVPYVKAIGLYQLKDEALSKAFGAKPPASASSFAPRASSLPDFAIQPLHDDVVAVVWGTASFWKALSPDLVCSLIADFMHAQSLQDEDSLLAHQEEASEFLLRKALVQVVVSKDLSECKYILMKKEGVTSWKSVKELLYHPAALRAAGFPHWKNPSIETERKAALGNKRAEGALMHRIVETQEKFLAKNKVLSSSQQPFVDTDLGVLVVLFKTST